MTFLYFCIFVFLYFCSRKHRPLYTAFNVWVVTFVDRRTNICSLTNMRSTMSSNRRNIQNWETYKFSQICARLCPQIGETYKIHSSKTYIQNLLSSQMGETYKIYFFFFKFHVSISILDWFLSGFLTLPFLCHTFYFFISIQDFCESDILILHFHLSYNSFLYFYLSHILLLWFNYRFIFIRYSKFAFSFMLHFNSVFQFVTHFLFAFQL